MRIERGRKKERNANSRWQRPTACAIHAFYYYTTGPLFRRGYTRAFLSVCEISFCGLCRRTGRAVRTFALATYPRSSSDVSSRSSHSAREEARLPRAQTRRCNVRIHNGRKCARRFGGVLTGARNRAGDKWLAEIGALKREVFSKWLIIIIIDRQATDKS